MTLNTIRTAQFIVLIIRNSEKIHSADENNHNSNLSNDCHSSKDNYYIMTISNHNKTDL